MAAQKSKRLAVLIDADNVSAKHAKALFNYISQIGDATERRLYGNFSDTNLQSWKSCFTEFKLRPWRVSQKTPGKNAADISLAVNAMDLLYSNQFDGFCIVSSDSDFTHLARRIREAGLAVYGFGEQKTPDSFVQACETFTDISSLQVGENKTKTKIKPRPRGTAVETLRKAIQGSCGKNGWVELRRLGAHIQKQSPNFRVRDYKFAKLSTLVKNLPEFEMAGNGSGMRVRIKPSKAA